MSQFSLSVRSFTASQLPDQPTDVPPSSFRSPPLQSIVTATSPLFFSISLPSSRDKDPLYPATHLQLTFDFKDTSEIFIPTFITAKDLTKSSSDGDGESNLYTVQVTFNDLPRTKVSNGGTNDAEANLYAWKNEKFLGKWKGGRVERLGIVGLKSHRIATVAATEV